MNCSSKNVNLKNCNCSYPGCENKGNCCSCISYHKQRRELPACYFSDKVEKTYNRSIKKFIEVESDR